MKRSARRLRKHLAASVSAAAVFSALLAAGPANADEAFAKQAFQRMSDYLGAQSALAFDYDSSLDVVTEGGRKFVIASSGAINLERPGALHATRDGGFASVALDYDGQTLTVVNTDANIFATIETAGSVDDLIDTLRNSYGQPLPAADLLSADVAAALTPLFTDVKDLGAGVIGGVMCDHFAFQTEQADLQIWIAQGDTPHPCRYVITDTSVTGWPVYRIDVRNWRAGDGAAGDVAFEVPAGATQVELSAVPEINELSGIYAK